MKKPGKNPQKPQIEAVETQASVPTLAVETIKSSSTANASGSVPSLNPPFESSGAPDAGFGAGIWHNDKRVNALYTTNETRNSWMSVVGTGWVKLANNIDSANEAFTVLATSAKVKISPVNYCLDNEQVTQIYVW